MGRLEELINSLDSLARTGWMLRGVPSTIAETVSQHLFASSLIALELGLRLKSAGVSIDPMKTAILALVHDLAESRIGDIAKTSGIDKASVELEAFNRLPVHERIKELYMEFEDSTTMEARIARIAELTATLLKAREYKRLGYYRVSEIEESSMRAISRLVGEMGYSIVGDLVNQLLGGRLVDDN